MRATAGFGGVLATVLLTVITGRRSVVKAQSLAALPTCAQPAILAAVQASGCSISDKKCFCSNPALVPSLTSAVQEACSEADRAALSAFASTYCGTQAGGALTSSPSASADTPVSTPGSSASTLPPATTSHSDSVSLSSSTITTTANKMTMNTTTTMSSSPTMTMNTTSSIDWPTNVGGNGAAQTGMAMAALAVAAGAMGWILEEL